LEQGRKLDRKIILLVEDNPDDVKLTLRAFRRNHIANEFIVAEDGAEALDYIFGTGKYQGRDLREMPQVVLLDLKLPKVDGLEVLRRLREDERTKLLPVVVLTSSQEEKHLISSLQPGVSSFIRKPVDFEQLVKSVEEAGLSWLVLNGPSHEKTPQ
jgi:CheY-like chemotaxis protein